MRWLVVACTFGLVFLLASREAHATCGGCCDTAAQLLGWSKDGRTIAVKETVDGAESQIVIYRDNKELERWAGTPSTGDATCLPAKPKLPANTFARLDLVSLDAAWRDRFRADYQITTGKQPVTVGQAKCSGYDIVNASGKVIASAVKQCDPNETDCVSGTVRGGYVHPSGAWVVVKTRVHGCGFTSHTSYRLVKP